MKKRLILLPIAGLMCYMLSSYSAGPGATAGMELTGATGTVGCSGGGSCHASAATAAISVKIELYDAAGTTLISPVQYTPGTAYKLRLTGTNTGSTTQKKFGFQLCAVKTGATTTNEGTLTAATGTHAGTYSGINIIEHSSALAPTSGTGGSGTTYVVEIQWIAPATGSGSVTAMATLNAVNGNLTDDPGDLWNNTTLAIPEATSSSSVAPVTGIMSVCVGATTTLSDATAGGTWSSGTTSVATVSSAGLVTGVAAGTAMITYNAGAAGNATATVTVQPKAPAAITGASVTCVGKTIALSNTAAGGTWSSTATTIATVSSSGVVTGVLTGTATISYTIASTCGTGSVTKVVAVHAAGTCAAGVSNTAAITGTTVQVYPNPNRGAFTITVASEDNIPAHVTITTLTGAVVEEYDTNTNTPAEIKLDRPAGIYFLSARTATGIYVSKVLTQ